MAFATGQTCLCSRWSAKVLFSLPRDFGAMGQDHNCMQLYILLITQSGYFRHKKCRRFRAGYKLRVCGEWCGLHPARKCSNRGLGALEDSPQLNTSASMCAGLSCAAVCECEATRTRKVPKSLINEIYGCLKLF